MIELELFSACVQANGADSCWPYQGGPTFLIDGKHHTPDRACLILHKVNIHGKRVTHTCGNPMCVNLKHLRVNGRYIRVLPKLFPMTDIERYWFDVDKTGPHWTWLGPPRIERGKKKMAPKVYMAELYGRPGCKAKDITSTCGDPKCVDPKHLLLNGEPFKKACPGLAMATKEDKFWGNITEMPYDGCHIWTGQTTPTGEPKFWNVFEYIPARFLVAKYLDLGFLPAKGAAGRTCGDIRCVKSTHFVDPRPLEEKWRAHFLVRDCGHTLEGRPSPCWLWAGGTRYRIWRGFVPDEFELRKPISPERVSLLVAGRGAYMGKITHECGQETCGHPDHLTRVRGLSFDQRELREDRA